MQSNVSTWVLNGEPINTLKTGVLSPCAFKPLIDLTFSRLNMSDPHPPSRRQGRQPRPPWVTTMPMRPSHPCLRARWKTR